MRTQVSSTSRTGLYAVFFLLAVLGLVENVAAQAQNPCFQLKGSQTCGPDLENFYVRSVRDFKDVASFDAYIKAQFDDNPTYQQGFRDFFGCSGWDGHNQQYHISTECFFFVQAGKCTENPTPLPQLCQTQCNQFISSNTAIFSNVTYCPANVNATIQQNRQDVITKKAAFANFCNTLNDGPTCKKGLESEFNKCGFFFKEDTAAYCGGAGKADPCCAVVTKSTLEGIAKGLAPVNNLPWIASGAALGAMILFGTIFVCCIKGKRWRNAGTTAVQPPESDIEPGPNRLGTVVKSAGDSNGGPFSSKSNRLSVFQQIRQSIMGGRARVDPPPPLPIMQSSTIMKPKMAMNAQSMYSAAPPPSEYGGGQDYGRPMTPAYSMYSAAPPGRMDGGGGGLQMKVVESYNAQLGDELTLVLGDVITVEEEFDDGWAVGRNENTGDVGAFPMSCLAPLNEMFDNSRPKSVISQRTKSLYSVR